MADVRRRSFGAEALLLGARLALLFFVFFMSVHLSHAGVELTDIAGRRVELAAPAKRILLDAPAYYPALSLVSKDAADLIVGVSTSPNGRAFGPEFEAGRDLIGKPRVGNIWAQTFSIEKALELKPDLLITALAVRGQATAIEDAFAKVGIPIIYVDFAENPARNTARSMEIIGRAIGAEQKAGEFVDFYRHHVDRLTDRLKSPGLNRPKLLIMSRGPGVRCCFASSENSVVAYFGSLGVENIAGGGKLLQSRDSAQLSLEYIIERDPDVFVAHAVGRGPDSLFGQPPTVAQGIASLEQLRATPGFSNLSAMRNGRVHAIDPFLSISPLNFLAFEVLAKWLYPELLADLDPQVTLDELNERFLATPLKGPFWVSLDPADDRASGRP